MDRSGEVLFEGRHCAIGVRRAAPGVVIVRFEGRDAGELGVAPFVEIERDLAIFAEIELFIDARDGRSASVDVSETWASWLRRHGAQLHRVHMLTTTRFVEMSADLVRKYSDLGERMILYGDPSAFEAALGAATVSAERGAG